MVAETVWNDLNDPTTDTLSLARHSSVSYTSSMVPLSHVLFSMLYQILGSLLSEFSDYPVNVLFRLSPLGHRAPLGHQAPLGQAPPFNRSPRNMSPGGFQGKEDFILQANRVSTLPCPVRISNISCSYFDYRSRYEVHPM